MRDARSLLLLLVSLLLVLVSFVLLWTWGYRYYNKNDELKVAARIVVPDSTAIANKVRDSLQKVFTETLHTLDSQLDSTLSNTDSLKAQLDIKLGEFYRLRNEITTILRNRNGDPDFSIAKQKIGELQNKASDIRDKTQLVDNENKKLGGILDQLKNAEKNPDKNAKQVGFDNTPPVEKNNTDNTGFAASELKLSAITINDDKESETTLAGQTEKLVGSFNVVNNSSQLNNAEMIVVVLQPDGRVLQTSGWESGTFNTPDGKKIYSYKLNFNYSKGENKRLLFTLKTDKYQKGNYTVQVYYNGTIIAKMVKTLS